MVDLVLRGSSRLVSASLHFQRVFTKLHIFNREVLPFDRVLFLDLDTLVVASIDRVFDKDFKLAAVACPTSYVRASVLSFLILLEVRSCAKGLWRYLPHL